MYYVYVLTKLEVQMCVWMCVSVSVGVCVREGRAGREFRSLVD